MHDNGVTSYSVVEPLIALYKTEVPFGPGKVRVRQGTLVSDLKPEMLDARPGSVDHIEVLRDPTSKTVFVVGFSAGSGGFPFPVHRFDGARLAWKATACTAGRQVLGGVGTLVLEMARVKDRLVVWSAESHGVAIDVFDAEKGDATMRYSSDLWMARQAP